MYRNRTLGLMGQAGPAGKRPISQALLRMYLPFGRSLFLCLMARSFSLDGRTGDPPERQPNGALSLRYLATDNGNPG
jgi:hypothetical protein